MSATLSRGIDATILRVLTAHTGRQNAIGGRALMNELSQRVGGQVHERVIRDEIKQLRRQGYLICSAPGEDGGYYMAANKAEFEEFDRIEFGAKIADMNETRQALLKAARVQFAEKAEQAAFL